MKLPDTDDLILFGSLALAALGVGLVAGVLTGELWLSIGLPLLFFGILSALIAFMAAAGETK